MIDIQALKSRFIDLAIRGKLVEQRPEEGTAEDLLEKIQAEKAQLIKEKKLKKDKPLDPIAEDEIPFAIPESWKWVRLSSIGEFISGYTPKDTELATSGTIPYFKVSDMNSIGNEVYMKKASLYVANAKKTFRRNTIIYPKNGGAVFTNKRRLLVTDSVVDLNTGGFLPSSLLNLQYIFNFFRFFDFAKISKGTALPTLDQEKLRNYLFPLPPVSEQQRIVAKLESILSVLNTAQDSLNHGRMTAQKIREGILQLAIQGKLVDQRPEEGTAEDLLSQIQAEKAQLIKDKKLKKDKTLEPIPEDKLPFDIPKTWKWVPLGEVFHLKAGKFISADEISDKGPYPCYGGNGLRGYVDRYNREGIFPLIGRQGALCGNVNLAQGQFYATEHAVVADSFGKIDPKCACLFLKALNLNQYATATAQPGLSVNKISETPYPLPPLSEQQRIVTKIEKIFSMLKVLEQS